MRPELKPRATPLAMLLFGMINWTFTWLRPGGALSHQALGPLVADLFFVGVTRAAMPQGAGGAAASSKRIAA